MGNARAAGADLKLAVEGIESVRGRLNLDEEKLTFFGEDKGALYVHLVKLLHAELKRAAEALEYVERARSRLFLDQLALMSTGRRETAPLEYEQIRECLRR